MSTHPDGPYEFDFPPELRPEDKASYGRPEPLPDVPPPTPPTETFEQAQARYDRMVEAAEKEGLPYPFEHEIKGRDRDGADDITVPGVPLPLDIMDKYGIIDPTDERQRAHLAAEAAAPTPPPAAKPRAKRARPVAPGAASPARKRKPSADGRAQVGVSLAPDERSILDSLVAESRLTRSQVVARLLINTVGRPTADVLFPRTPPTT